MERFTATGRRTAVLLLGLGLGLPVHVAAQAPRREVVRPVDFATSQDDNLFSLQRSQEQIHAYETALQELDRGEHEAAVERLHKLLQADNGGVVPVGPGRYVGLRVAVVVAMANLPAPAQQAYEDLVRREAGALRAPLERLSREQLLLAAERFPAAELGRAARLRLGDLALERGDGLDAAGHYRQALDATTIGSRDELRAFQRLQQAQVLCDPPLARAEAIQGRLEAVGDDLLRALPAPTGAEPVTYLGGAGSGAAPSQPPAGSLAAIWSYEVAAPFFDRSDSGQHAMHAVGDLDGIYVNTGHEVLALDPLRRDRAWSTISPMRDETHDYRDSCNNDTVLACSIDDELVVAALQVPDRSVNVDFNGGLRIMWKIPQRRLYAFDRQSGKVVWSHFDELDGPRTRRFRGHDSCGSPLLLGDTVYAPTHDRPGAIQFCVAAYEARTGQPKWRRLICSSQQDVNMFGNAQADFTASPLRHAGGVLFGSSNLGVVYALEAATGRVRWITAYEVVRMPRVSMHRQVERTVYFANNPPVVLDGVVCSTPLDSQFVLAHDVETGQPLWRLPSEATIAGTDHHVQWLCGALGREFVLAGGGCVAVAPRPTTGSAGQPAARSLVPPDRLAQRRERGQARPALTVDRLWVPRPERLLAFDSQGALVETVPLPRLQPGNLLLVGGLVVSVRQRSFDVIADPAALLDRFEAKVEESPDDPQSLLRLASLRRALLPEDATTEQMAPVLAAYRRGLEACRKIGLPDQHPTHLALRNELFAHAFRQARISLAAGRADARELLVAARDSAPTEPQWIDCQALVLEASEGDRERFLVELDRLGSLAPDGVFPFGEGIPVAAFVLWQQALRSTDPDRAVAAWQRLLEEHPAVSLLDGSGAQVARDAIATLIARHGEKCYAPIAARAEALLGKAGEDRAALELLVARFPNSQAAARAGSRLMDLAVRAGDLALAGSVLAEAAARGAVPPGVLRRVLFAAEARGNRPLADALAARLAEHRAATSDWPDDAGRTYGAVLDARSPAATTPLPSLREPSRQLGKLATRDFVLVLRVQRVPGFGAPVDPPVWVGTGNEVRAIEPLSDNDENSPRYAFPYEYLEHVLLCGPLLVVPDMSRVHAVDAATGAARWELPNPRARTYESLGVLDGVLLLLAQARSGQGPIDLLAVEPTSGALLHQTVLGEDLLKPKVAGEALLGTRVTADGGLEVFRIDPLTGRRLDGFQLPAGSLQSLLRMQPESITTRHYPQAMAIRGDRLFLPTEPGDGTPPEVVAVGRDGTVARLWRGRPGGMLAMMALRGDTLCVAEFADRQNGRMLLLSCSDGTARHEVDLGTDAAILNWERSWLANPAPAIVAIESFADEARRQRQLLCYGVDDPTRTFEVKLGADEGEVMLAPQFGDDFLTFATRARRGAGALRLYCLGLADRAGRFPDGQKHRRIDLAGNRDGMTAHGPHLVLAGAQGLVLLGSTPDASTSPR